MKFKSIIFDLDGTLLNTLDDLTASVNYSLLIHSFPIHKNDIILSFIGDGAYELISRAMPEENKSDKYLVQKLVEVFEYHYEENCFNKTQAYDGVNELLIELFKTDIILNILSNKPDKFTKQLVDKYFKRQRFNEIIGESDLFPRKPNPASAIEIAKRNNIKTSEIIFVGDSAADILTAISSGMYPVGVSWGYRSKEALFKSGAKVIIDNPIELLKIL